MIRTKREHVREHGEKENKTFRALKVCHKIPFTACMSLFSRRGRFVPTWCHTLWMKTNEQKEGVFAVPTCADIVVKAKTFSAVLRLGSTHSVLVFS